MKYLLRFLFWNICAFCTASGFNLAEPLTGNYTLTDWFWLCSAVGNLVFMVIVVGRYAWHAVEDGR